MSNGTNPALSLFIKVTDLKQKHFLCRPSFQRGLSEMTFFHHEKCNYATITRQLRLIIPVPTYALKLKLTSKFAQLAGRYICQLL